MSEVRITGVYVNYYYICQRKLWLFSKNITMEDKSDLVTIGKLIDENSYKREEKHIDIDNTINIDFIGNKGTIHEVKKSDSMENADLFQVKYYLYYLYKRGVENIEGVINYPKLRQKVNVKLNQTDINEIETLLDKIKKILELEIPPPFEKQKFVNNVPILNFASYK